MSSRHESLMAERNARADRAYELALEPARRSLTSPKRVPYTVAIVDAIAAYDAVIAEYRLILWPGSRAA